MIMAQYNLLAIVSQSHAFWVFVIEREDGHFYRYDIIHEILPISFIFETIFSYNLL